MIDIKKTKTFPIKERPSKVNIDDFAGISTRQTTIEDFVDRLPNILAASDFKKLVQRMRLARKNNRSIIWSIGAHVIKTGLNTVIIELMKAGYVNHIAINGAAAIHDAEISMIGESSEEVGEGIADGTFGMVFETGELINSSFKLASDTNIGAGEALGKVLEGRKTDYRHLSIIHNAWSLGVPVSVHVAIGTDIIHMHPNVDAAAIGRATFTDFLLFCHSLSKLEGGGGVYLNIGSAVILPEVFLKAITVCRNHGYKISEFTIASFDFIRQYRPFQNVVSRPSSALSCEGMEIVGHHEIMLPLLSAALLDGEAYSISSQTTNRH